MTAEYVIHAKVKNNLLLSRILSSEHKTVGAFSKAHGLSPSAVGNFVNMKERALRKDGSWTVLAMKLSVVLGVDPEELFSEEQRVTALKSNEAFIEMTRQQALEAVDPLTALENKDLVSKLLSRASLSDQHKEVLRLRFFEGNSLREAAQQLEVSPERIRQIEAVALRKLRNKSHMIVFPSWAIYANRPSP